MRFRASACAHPGYVRPNPTLASVGLVGVGWKVGPSSEGRRHSGLLPGIRRRETGGAAFLLAHPVLEFEETVGGSEPAVADAAVDLTNGPRKPYPGRASVWSSSASDRGGSSIECASTAADRGPSRSGLAPLQGSARSLRPHRARRRTVRGASRELLPRSLGQLPRAARVRRVALHGEDRGEALSSVMAIRVSWHHAAGDPAGLLDSPKPAVAESP
jgi:hypothetical protein